MLYITMDDYVTVCCILRWMTMLQYVVSYDGWLCYSMLYLTMDDYVTVCCILRWMTMLQYVVSYDGWLCYSMLYLTMGDYATVCCILRWMTMLQYVVSYDGWLSKMSVLMLQYCEVKWMTARCHGIHVWLCIMSRDGLQDLCAYDAILCLEMNEMSDCKILVLMTQYCISRWVTARSRYWQYWWTSYLIKKIFQHMQW
jgi:hypothetical protein